MYLRGFMRTLRVRTRKGDGDGGKDDSRRETERV